MFDKLKLKLKNRKPMNEKKKALLKGLVFGFLAGGIATLTAVGVVGCSMTQGNGSSHAATPSLSSKAPAPKRAFDDSDIDASAYTNLWDVNAELEIDGHVLYEQDGVLWSSATTSQTEAKVYTMELRTPGLYYMEIEHPGNTWGAVACLNFNGFAAILTTPSGGRSNLTTNAYWYDLEKGFFYVSESYLFEDGNDGKFYLCASQNSVNAQRPMPKVYLVDGFDFVSDTFRVPNNFWGCRLLNGSYDPNTGGVYTSVTGNFGSIGGFRISNLMFSLGDSRTVYKAIQFYFQCVYGSRYIDGSGVIQNANADSFKNVFVLGWIQALPYDGDPSTSGDWVMLGSSLNGVDSYGNVYRDAHTFQWFDESYRVFHLWESKALSDASITPVGNLFTAAALNPSMKNVNVNNALRVALLGTSANSGSNVVIGGDGYSDVFSLIGSAFSSLTPLLTIQVLPFLSLGTLLLVPLVVLIIFAILKVLNK